MSFTLSKKIFSLAPLIARKICSRAGSRPPRSDWESSSAAKPYPVGDFTRPRRNRVDRTEPGTVAGCPHCRRFQVRTKTKRGCCSVSVITRSEIKAFGWRTLAEALASLPGIHTTYDRQYSYLGTRGFGLPGDLNTRILLTINGNRVNDVVYDQATIGRDFPLDLDLIERIEFIPGPGGAVYGQNAMFGVVNVVTRTGGGVDGTELAASYQSPQAAREGRATWGKMLDNGVDVLLSASGLQSPGRRPLLHLPWRRPRRNRCLRHSPRHGRRRQQGILLPSGPRTLVIRLLLWGSPQR